MTLSIGRILGSLALIVFVGAAAISATGAFFSDTETSTGNTFKAGDIDLQIDNESYAIDYNIPGYQNPVGAFVESVATSWDLVDLTVEKFFNFVDLKPGDYGEDTISLHVGSNNAWVCAAARLTTDADNSITEPEDEVAGPNNDDNDGTTDGDLDSGVNFAFWVDDGNNVFETDETVFLQGPLSGLDDAGQIALADSDESIMPNDGPIPGNSTFYIGKVWCYGNLTPNPVLNATSTPLGSGTGWNCDGSLVGNIGQTDSVVGDLQFFAVQSRNNSSFQCQSWVPVWPNNGTLTITKVVNNGELADNPQDFDFQVNGGAATAFEVDGSNAQSVAPGNYSVTEVAEVGFTTTYSNSLNANADCNNLAVPANGNVTCTVTNTLNI